MLTFKYYEKIKDDQAKTRAEGADLSTPFDLEELGADSRWRRFSHSLFDRLSIFAFRLLRRFWPIAKVGRLVIVSRRDDVLDVLTQPDAFESPFGLEMTELAGGENFVLGLEGPEHEWQRDVITSVIKRDDVVALSDLARIATQHLIANARGRIDAIKDLYTRVSAETCAAYFGLAPADTDAFADWTLAVSTLLFADPFGNPKTRALALKGAAGMRGVIDRALAARAFDENTLIGRLKRRQIEEPRLTDAKIRAILVGLATGLIPTTTLAAGRIVEALLKREEALRQVAKAAATGDKRRLQTLLFEAARLNPALSPGQWRYARKDGVIAKGTSREKRVPSGSVILVGTASALVDMPMADEPYAFGSDRSETSYALVFGDGIHNCLGKWVAMALITEISGVLFRLPDLRPAPGFDGKLGWIGPFPRRLDMQFRPIGGPAGSCMSTIAIPLASAALPDEIRAKLAELGNPVRADVKAALDAANLFHFVSMSVLDFGSPAEPKPHIVIEINADGDDKGAIDAFSAALEPWLAPIIEKGTRARSSLSETLINGELQLKTRPFGAIGLNFSGLGEFSVPDIDRQSKLADFARRAVDAHLQMRLTRSGQALDALRFVRGLIKSDESLRPLIERDTSGRLAALAETAKDFVGDLLLPSRRRLALMDWTKPSAANVLSSFLKDPNDLPTLKLAIVAMCVALATAAFITLPWQAEGAFLNALLVVAKLLVALIIGILEVGLIVLILLGAAVAWLRVLESRDKPDNRDPTLASIRAAATVEDAPGFAQNHFASVSDLKSGWFRKLTLAVALWAIKELVARVYRPGFVIDLGTINFARWFRPPGAEKLVFFSNFDGSWLSYLEDFITKCHAGQSAAWSNAVGFPKTEFLVLGGAKDGDSFKRWVRRQQVPSPFWYARFETLPADIKRANALIHFGLARACDESQARDWLSQFGSMARPEAALENEEVQSLVFRGFRGLPHGIFATIRFPVDRKRLRHWLRRLAGHADADQRGDPSLQLAFGDNPFNVEDDGKAVVFAAFSAEGIQRAGFPASKGSDESTAFPSAFNLGMAARAKILGDFGASAPEGWRWSDGEGGVDAILIIFGRTPTACAEHLEAHARALGEGCIGNKIVCGPTDQGVGYEPFGFRDGLSQPAIKGTRRAGHGVSSADIMEAGEFLLGYENNEGFRTPSPTVPEEYDPFNRLPLQSTATRTEYPQLDAKAPFRDFGRNGAFLAIRQLKQDVEGFHRQSQELARGLSSRAYLADVVGAPVSSDWIEAKMMGRWHDGSSLLGRPPHKQATADADDRIDNDFDFGSEDPEGFRCPLGSHIRRSNPRDGLRPGDTVERGIVNRHRIIRRGRPYRSDVSPSSETGLVFVAVCADIERQFEFIQQSWINAPGFENLHDEPDPIAGTGVEDARRSFTIPTPAGPVLLPELRSFVETRAGGYFFLPSLSALLFLSDLEGRTDSALSSDCSSPHGETKSTRGVFS